MRPWGFLLVLFLALGWIACEDATLEELRLKLEGETDPGDRAKLAAKIGDHLLDQVGARYREGEFEKGEEKLEEYLDLVRAAQRELQDSGRDAWDDPKGFKELEIHLRQGERRLHDIERRVPFDRRELVAKARAEVIERRAQLLSALLRLEFMERPASPSEGEERP